MNRHVGASFTLSVMVVAFFAVVLHQTDPQTQQRMSPGEAASTAKSKSVAAAPVSGSASEKSFAETVVEPIAKPDKRVDRTADGAVSLPILPSERVDVRPLSSGGGESLASREITGSERAVSRAPSSRARPVSRRRSTPSERRPSFTEVGEGESLTDVAVRVYGTTDASRTLWLANRDIIEHRDAPLRMGTLLRTP